MLQLVIGVLLLILLAATAARYTTFRSRINHSDVIGAFVFFIIIIVCTETYRTNKRMKYKACGSGEKYFASLHRIKTHPSLIPQISSGGAGKG